MISCGATAILYPYCTAFGGIKSDLNDHKFIILFLGEIVILLDIFATFLLAYTVEGYQEYVLDLRKIAQRYVFQGTFFKDLVICLPIYELRMLAPWLEICSLIKTVRVFQLFDYISKKRVMPMIRDSFKNSH